MGSFLPFQKINNFVLDTLFPISCLSCGKSGVWLCPDCSRKINILSSQVCPYCEKEITDGGRACPKCRQSFLAKSIIIPIDALICATKYKENNVSRLVYAYKYNFISDLSEILGKILVSAILKNNLPLPDVIIPVPLHKKRLRWRGFNQSELLASFIGQNLTPGFPLPVFSDFLKRKKHISPQMKIKNYKERQRNIKNVFIANHKDFHTSCEEIKNKRILLVDDIATTGATLNECGKILKANGAREVAAIVIARQELGKN